MLTTHNILTIVSNFIQCRCRLPVAPLVAVLPQAVRALLAALQGGPTHRDHRQPRVTAALSALLQKALLAPPPVEANEDGSGSSARVGNAPPSQLQVSVCQHLLRQPL